MEELKIEGRYISIIVDVFIHFCMHSLYGSNPIILWVSIKKKTDLNANQGQ